MICIELMTINFCIPKGGALNTASGIVFAAVLALAGTHAQAGDIIDSGSTAYWGGNDHGYKDVIGGTLYDIQGASITRADNVLKIVINTNFAGHAGVEQGQASKGIGYGDVFLSNTWNPAGNDAHHLNDNASNGTVWDYGFALDNRYSNTGGTFSLYALNGARNSQNVKTSASFMDKCTLGSSCYYRDGQAVAVNTASSTVAKTGLTGTWSVDKDDSLTFSINLSGSELLNWSSFAMHWGETCQNDVIEGITAVRNVPLPGSASLLFLGLGALAAVRRRRRA
jgi:hypothetical protein